MGARAIACRQLVELATGYLENALTRSQLSAVRTHLAGCDDCERFLAQLRVVIALNRNRFDAADESLSASTLDSITRSFRRRSASG